MEEAKGDSIYSNMVHYSNFTLDLLKDLGFIREPRVYEYLKNEPRSEAQMVQDKKYLFHSRRYYEEGLLTNKSLIIDDEVRS
jgi:hypothetical protein